MEPCYTECVGGVLGTALIFRLIGIPGLGKPAVCVCGRETVCLCYTVLDVLHFPNTLVWSMALCCWLVIVLHPGLPAWTVYLLTF